MLLGTSYTGGSCGQVTWEQSGRVADCYCGTETTEVPQADNFNYSSAAGSQ
jgi:hypothetical protein